MPWGKKRFVHGRGPLKRSKLLPVVYILLVGVIVFAPWQTVVLREYANWRSHVTKALGVVESDSTTLSGDGVTPVIVHLTDPVHAYGIAAGGTLAAMSEANINKELDDITSLGASWIRFDVDWSNIQPQDANHYTWARYDKIAQAASAHHLKMLGVLAYTPVWAHSSSCQNAQCPPKNAADFASFAAAAAARYAPMGVQAWEVWNEPNTATFWQGGASPTGYTALLQATYTAIKLANPQALVITGGVSPQANGNGNVSELDFLQGIYKAGGKGFFDAVAVHPYTFPMVPSDSTGQAWSRMSQTGVSLRSIMTANGDAVKKIWITEFGAPTGGSGPSANEENYATVHDTWHVDEQLQADMMQRAAQLYKMYDWVGPLLWYSYKDAGTDQSNSQNFFGLLRADGSHKPAYDAFKKAVTVN